MACARGNTKILERIWTRILDKKEKIVSTEILIYERFVFDSQVLPKRNNNTKKNIMWFYDYGLEMRDDNGLTYEIHKKP